MLQLCLIYTEIQTYTIREIYVATLSEIFTTKMVRNITTLATELPSVCQSALNRYNILKLLNQNIDIYTQNQDTYIWNSQVLNTFKSKCWYLAKTKKSDSKWFYANPRPGFSSKVNIDFLPFCPQASKYMFSLGFSCICPVVKFNRNSKYIQGVFF